MSNINDVLSMSDADPGYNLNYLDDTYYYNNSMDGYVSRMTTFFTPPHDGEYQFQLRANDGAKLFINDVRIVAINYLVTYDLHL